MTTKKMKKGYDWIEEQQEFWDTIVADKMNQIDQVVHSHLDWLHSHNTISDLLAWKNPSINDTIGNNDPITEEPVESNEQEPIELNQEIGVNDPRSIVPTTEETNHSEEIATKEQMIDNKPIPIEELITNDDMETAYTSALFDNQSPPPLDEEVSVLELNQPQDDPKENIDPIAVPAKRKWRTNVDTTVSGKTRYATPELDPDMDSQKTTKQPSTPEQSFIQIDDDDDDIQLVQFKGVTSSPITSVHPTSPMRPSNPIQPPPTSPIKPPPASKLTRPRTPFMNRLFQMGSMAASPHSLKDDVVSYVTVRPRPSESASTVMSEKSNNISMNLLIHPPTVAEEEIEVSDAMPQSRSAMLKKKQKQKPLIAKQKKTEEEEEEEETFEIPDWAKDPQLTQLLKQQTSVDPNFIFGNFQTLKIAEVFPQVRPKIPKQPPISYK